MIGTKSNVCGSGGRGTRRSECISGPNRGKGIYFRGSKNMLLLGELESIRLEILQQNTCAGGEWERRSI